MALPPSSLDSTVLVTGASSGIGAHLARELARRGHNVVLAARRADRLGELATALRAQHGVRADVEAVDLADAAQRAALVERLRQGADREVVGVCNNAGFGSLGRFHELPPEREAVQVRLNAEALHALTAAFLPRMVEQGTGAVLNVASVAGFQPVPGMATYSATKAFVIALSESVHAELRGTGVSVTCVCPGPVRTAFGEKAGMGGAEGQVPGVVRLEPSDVARQAIAAMVAGRRSVVPGLHNKALSLGGRLVPRSLYLPLANRLL
jgi:short-subunit dehydrogenase